jgi:hypothetical protein
MSAQGLSLQREGPFFNVVKKGTVRLAFGFSKKIGPRSVSLDPF